MKTYSVQNILDWLETKGLLKKRKEAEAFILSQENRDKLPIYISLLMGIGAALGSTCVTSFLFVSHLVNPSNAAQLLICGLVFIVLALICYYSLRYKTSLLQSLGIQTALILMFVGKLIFVMGFKELSHYIPLNSSWMVTVGLGIVTVPFYALFPLQVDRFLFSLFLLSSILYNTVFLYSSNLLFFSYFIVLTLGTILLFTWRNKSNSWGPLAYAFAITLCLSALPLSTFYYPLDAIHYNLIGVKYFNLILGIGLILTCLLLAKEKSAAIQLSTISACIGLGILAYISTPGILISLLFLILGTAKYERSLSLIGGTFLCLFIVEYYYTLNYTLDIKAGILVASGAVMLIAGTLIKSMKWDKEN